MEIPKSLPHLRRPKRWVRVLLAAPLLLGIAVLQPVRLVVTWTGLAPGAAVAALLVLIAAALWITEAVALFVTSFVILFLELAWLMPTLAKQDVLVDSSAFLAPFFSNVILLFLGGFVLSTAFRKYQLDRVIARYVLRKTAGRPRAVMGAVVFVTAFLSMWMSNTATAAMMLGLSLPMVDQTDRDDPIRRGLPLAVAVGANLGGLGTPIGTPPNAIVVDALARRGSPVGFATWMAMSLPILLVLLVVSFWLLTKLFPPRIERLNVEAESTLRLSKGSYGVVAVTAATGLLWLTSGLHPWATGTVALIPVIVLFGTRLLDRKDFQNLPWDVLILAGGGLSLGVAVQQSGLGDAIVFAIPVERLGQSGVVVAVTLVAALMTTFMSNTATANLLVPVVAGLSGAAPATMLVVVAYACSCTMVLPVSTPPNAMVFSSGQLVTRDLVKTGLIVSAMALLVTVFIAPLWWSVFGIGLSEGL